MKKNDENGIFLLTSRPLGGKILVRMMEEGNPVLNQGKVKSRR